MTHSPSGSTAAEAEAFLDAHPQIEAFDIILHDANGIGRGKIIRRHELLSFYNNGRHLPISILGLDICGEVFMSMYMLDGAPMTSDPRHALQRQVDLMAAEGLHPAGAFELEFFLLDPERGPDGKMQPARDVLDRRKSAKTEVYSVDHLHGMLPLFSDIYAGAEKAGIKAETLISEYAPGQYELTLHYRENVMQAADDLMRLKRIVRAQARAHGVVACFMAKPNENYAGSGMHFHVSLLDDNGKNVFIEKDEGKWNPTILHALGGLKQTMAESMLVFAPHANSWRRFASQSYAPVSPTWGVNNRSVALRIPAGDIKARRIEHRPAGVDANPYLVATTVLAGVRKGMKDRIDPGPETTGNGYEDEGSAAIPTDWKSAIDAAKQSTFLQDALGEDMHRTFTAIMAAEYARVMRTVSEVDFDLYLHTV
ncbi:MAG: glutamine synthetase family protein [Tabrizicola sp.]|nr:glutamine synthetase family protein [Tabrizicola sp.]